MSYILDALRRADAERDRGNVPGIHAQPSFGSPLPTNAQPAAKPWVWLAGGAAAVMAVGGVAWYVAGASRGETIAAMPPAPMAAPTAAAPAIVATPAPAPLPAPAMAPAPVAIAPSPFALAQPAPNRVEAAATAARKPRPALPATSAAPAGDATAVAAQAKPAETGDKVYAIAELPDGIRTQLPPVAVGGSMYSTKPADRILIINGQVLHEGDRIAPDLTLLQIRLKGALLNFKGYRYTIAY